MRGDSTPVRQDGIENTAGVDFQTGLTGLTGYEKQNILRMSVKISRADAS